MGVAWAGGWAYCGTYEDAPRESLFQLAVEPASGRLTVAAATAGVDRPSFLAAHPRGPWLYVVSEAPQAEGALWAMAIGPAGALSPLTRRPAHGRLPCHIAVDPSARVLLAANYGGPGVTAYRLDADGVPAHVATVVHHAGAGPHARQEGPHPHAAQVDRTGRFAYCPDLGADRVMIYRLGTGRRLLAAAAPAFAGMPPGSGPRHLAFHPQLPCAYVVCELDSTVAVCAWDPATGALAVVQTVSTLPEGAGVASAAAEVQVHPGGRFVYCTNRGHDSIAAFRVDPADGRLALAAHVPSGGRTPRHCALDRDGRFLYVLNQDSDGISIFWVDPDSGVPQATGDGVRLPRPACLCFSSPPA